MKTHQGGPDGSGLHVALVVSRFNSVVTERLLQGALGFLRSSGVAEDAIEVARVPGAFEIPLAAQAFADRGRVSAVICLGAVIRGETPHFEYISQAVFHSLAQISTQHRLPVALGVLTTNTLEQALARAGDDAGNKGREAAQTAIEMANLRKLLA